MAGGLDALGTRLAKIAGDVLSGKAGSLAFKTMSFLTTSVVSRLTSQPN